MHTAATYVMGIGQGRAINNFRFFMFIAAKGLGMTLAPTPGELLVLGLGPLIVFEIGSFQMRTLFKHHNRKAGL